MFGLQLRLQRAARKLAAFSIAGILALIGAGFLTVAAWITLAEMHSAAFAALIIGAVYFGAALIVMAIGLSRFWIVPVAAPAAAAAPVMGAPMAGLTPMQMVILSFVQGLEQGRMSRRRP